MRTAHVRPSAHPARPTLSVRAARTPDPQRAPQRAGAPHRLSRPPYKITRPEPTLSRAMNPSRFSPGRITLTREQEQIRHEIKIVLLHSYSTHEASSALLSTGVDSEGASFASFPDASFAHLSNNGVWTRVVTCAG